MPTAGLTTCGCRTSSRASSVPPAAAVERMSGRTSIGKDHRPCDGISKHLKFAGSTLRRSQSASAASVMINFGFWCDTPPTSRHPSSQPLSSERAGAVDWKFQSRKIGCKLLCCGNAQYIRVLPADEGHGSPSGADWLHEVKYDGYRLRIERDGDRVRLFPRNGYDRTGRYPWIVEAA